MERFYKEIIREIKKKGLSGKRLNNAKLKLCRKYGLSFVPTNIQILLNADKKDIRGLGIEAKPSRTVSGVAAIAVMAAPYACPHGKCIYCPGGPGSSFGSVPQSYTGKEPASRRAVRANFSAYLQVFNRLEQYMVSGHVADKAELIIMGGTFPAMPRTYQKRFVAECFQAMNDFSKAFFRKNRFDIEKFKEFFELPGDFRDLGRIRRVHKKIFALKKKTTLGKEQSLNETARIRCIGLTIETRPDYATLKDANFMLGLGCTRVEIGVQSVYDDVLRKINRGHTVKETISSFRALKDLGFKINAHYMLGLPGSSEKKDLAGLGVLFRNSCFRPDMLKIYPCMVFRGTRLYSMWKKGKYRPMTTKQAAKVIASFKSSIVPRYVRIMRVQRDIPTMFSEAGVDKTNLRQYVQQAMKAKKTRCRCIRCREAGRMGRKITVGIIKTTEYAASGGTEFFIEAADKNSDALIGYCRMRFPSAALRKEISKDTAVIREVHIYAPLVGIGKKSGESLQHRGTGAKLIKEAENMAARHKKKKMLVISGIGARQYFRKFGYRKEGPYMSKKLG